MLRSKTLEGNKDLKVVNENPLTNDVCKPGSERGSLFTAVSQPCNCNRELYFYTVDL